VRRLGSNIQVTVAVVLGVALILIFAGYAAFRGLGSPSVPSGDIALVKDAPNGDVTKAEFEADIQQTAAQQGLPKPPKPSDPQYPTIRDAAINDLLLSRWIRGEAQDRGIEVSETEVSDQLDQLIKQQFGGQQQFQSFLKQSGFSEQDAHDRVELSLLANRLQEAIVPQQPSIDADLIKNYYEANIDQFKQPETRDFREIFNKDQAKVEQAQTILQKDDSAKSWETVASKYSTDPTSNKTGGLRKNVAEGQSDPTVDQQVFSAPEGQLVGPFQAGTGSQAGYYLIEVEQVNAAKTSSLTDVSKQIEQQLVSITQQQAAQNFQTDFIDKWSSRTFCAAGYVTDHCANFVPTSQQVPGSAAVASVQPVAPGSAASFSPTPPTGTAQGPCGFTDPTAKPPLVCAISGTSAAPQGATGAGGVIGPSGAPVPPGSVPPGSAPPGSVPPGSAPPPSSAPPPPPGG